MRLLAIILVLVAAQAQAQSSTVGPGVLGLSVSVEDTGHTPFVREMVLITIRGTYRRRITRETLDQPDLKGFNWAQLGPDQWTDTRINGKSVKVFQRRMALYPTRAGRLTIGPFTHHLTLTDESNRWFRHDVRSVPVTVSVAPAPALNGWWFPVRSLKVSDTWSNAPSQLKPGKGVLRVIRIEALGAVPEMIPPMPELTSPSAMIFAHPEKRLVELTPYGPVTHAFWRWTIQPTNGTSAIVRPLTIPYYDTTERMARIVRISAQRVAYEETLRAPPPPAPPAHLPGFGSALLAATVFLGGIGSALWGRRLSLSAILGRLPWLDPPAIRMRRSARQDDAVAVRRIGTAMIARDGDSRYPNRASVLAGLDRTIFGKGNETADLRRLVSRFLER